MTSRLSPASHPMTALLAALEACGPRPALVWWGEGGRIELSGHVLANWCIKAIGHLHEEIDLHAGDTVLVTMPPHWKRLVLCLAAWSLGAEVRLAAGSGSEGLEAIPEDPRVLVTTDPSADGPLADMAEEVLVADPVSLAMRASAPLPPLAHDWVLEVRAHADQLGVPLVDWSGPALAEIGGPAASMSPAEDSSLPLLLTQDGLENPAAALAALQAGRILVGPAGALTPQQLRAEGVSPAP